ncbi:TPA: hypothetical protein I4D94_20680 [Enterobacter asburiae]|nr:hypothetical protein DJ544_22155 [Enterobacter roggenkampii]HAS1942544.1 hypothetical protein [Enterobacter asburiae]
MKRLTGVTGTALLYVTGPDVDGRGELRTAEPLVEDELKDLEPEPGLLPACAVKVLSSSPAVRPAAIRRLDIMFIAAP